MKKKILAFLTAAILMGSSAFGVEPTLVVLDGKLVRVDNVVQPTVTIQVPGSSVDLGEIVKIECKLDGEQPTFVKKKSYKWSVTERGYVKQFWEQDGWVIFGTGLKASTVRIGCQVTLVYEVGTQEVTKVIDSTADLKIGVPEPTPDPTPPPGPVIPPAPPVPAPLTGLAANARDWAIAVGPTNKTQTAPVIASTLTSIAARIGNDTSLNSPRSILTLTKTQLNSDLTKGGFNPKDWDQWGVKLTEYAYQQYQAGTMTKIEDYKKAWNDLAAGLNAVK